VGAHTLSPQLTLRLILVVIAVLLAQLTIGLDIRIAGAHPDFMLGLPIVAGLIGGPRRGAVIGFSAGLAADLFLPTPFGLSALVGCLAGYSAGRVSGYEAEHGTWVLTPTVALIWSAAATMLYAVLGAVLGQQEFLQANLGVVVAVVSLTNAVVALPLRALMSWTAGRKVSPWHAELVSGDRP
jgi:rod shape-determining protein MreD